LGALHTTATSIISISIIKPFTAAPIRKTLDPTLCLLPACLPDVQDVNLNSGGWGNLPLVMMQRLQVCAL
jgi:hypothetical protein